MSKHFETAGELKARLEADPEFVARRERTEAERQARQVELRRAEEPLRRDLLKVGVSIASVWDLVNTASPYPAALPVLLKHLTQAYPGPVKDGIARALAVPQASFAWPTVVQAYREEHDARVKDGLAAALAVIGGNERLDEIIALAGDRTHGFSRVLLLGALERSREPRATAALMALGSDPDLQHEIQVILRKRKRRAKGR